MEEIRWSSAYSVGVEEMDRQHKKLISLINRLGGAEQRLVTPEELGEMLKEMAQYANDHFQAEEALLEQHAYRDLAGQIEQHLHFIETAHSFMHHSELGTRSVVRSLLPFLQNWMVQHILLEDMKYKSFFQDIQK